MPRGGWRPGAGRRPKPTILHLLHGTWRRDRHGPRPTKPETLNIWQGLLKLPPMSDGCGPAEVDEPASEEKGSTVFTSGHRRTSP
jgi:hypothetical protein